MVDLPNMFLSQEEIFKAMAVSNTFDDEGTERQESLRSIWHLTRRVFGKEEEEKAMQEAQARKMPGVKQNLPTSWCP